MILEERKKHPHQKKVLPTFSGHNKRVYQRMI